MKRNTQMIDPDTQINPRETCAILKCHKVTLWRLMKLEDFPKPARFEPDNPRSRLRFSRSEILAWIESRRQLTTEAKRSSGRRGIHGSEAYATE
jgi:predicted DNA-binding transcriptional regulator AlpA